MAGRRRGYGLHDSTGYWLNRLLAAIRDLLEQSFAEHDVTGAQWTVLISLFRGDAETPKELAEFIGIDRSAVTRLLDRLEAKGLVVRQNHGRDRRSIRVRLTDAGTAMAPELVRMSKRANKKLLRGISPAEIQRFQSTVERMLANAP